MNDGITISVLSRAADVIAETNNGLSGPKVVSYCNTFAVDHDIRIPHAAYPFQAGNKRTALLENLRAFPPQLQYSLLMELCADWSLRDNQDVQAIRQLIQQRYSHLDTSTTIPPSPFAQQPAPLVPAGDTAHHTAPAPAPPPLPEIPSRPYDIFLSYSHADEALMTLVREHLVLLRSDGPDSQVVGSQAPSRHAARWSYHELPFFFRHHPTLRQRQLFGFRLLLRRRDAAGSASAR